MFDDMDGGLMQFIGIDHGYATMLNVKHFKISVSEGIINFLRKERYEIPAYRMCDSFRRLQQQKLPCL